MNKKLVLNLAKLAAMLGAASLASCGSGACAPGTGNGSNGGTYNLVVDNTSPIPLINVASKQFYVYMTNVGNGNATDLSWSVTEPSASASSGVVKSLWNSVKNSLGVGGKSLTAAGDIKVLDASECVNVKAGASCRMLLQADNPASVNLQSTSPTSKSAITDNILSAYTYVPSYSGPSGALTLSPLSSVNYGNGFAGYTFFIINNSPDAINLDQAPFGTLPAGIDYSTIAGVSCPNPVPALSSCQVRMTLTAPSNSTGSTVVVSLTPTGSVVGGSALPPQATGSLTASSEKLGNVNAGSTSMVVDANSTVIVSSYASISNTGSGPLVLGNLSSGNSLVSISADECSGQTIAVGASCRYQLNIDPTKVSGSGSSVITIPYNDGKNSGSTSTGVNWSYVATVVPAPSISITSSGNLSQNSLSSTITIQNTGNVLLTNLSSLVLSPTNPRVTATNNNCGSRLASAASCTYTLTYAPTAPSEDNTVGVGGITATYVDNNGNVQSFAPSTTSSVNVSSTFQGFLATGGDFSLNATTPSKTVTITNTGNYTATLSNIAISGSNLQRSGGSCVNGDIAPRVACTVIVSLINSTAAASGNGSLNLTYDNHNGNTATPATSNISWVVGEAASLSVTFAQSNMFALVGGESSTLVTLLNNGNTSLTNIVLPAAPTGFSWVQNSLEQNGCSLSGQSLASGVDCTLTLKYTPTTSVAGATVTIGRFSATTGQGTSYTSSNPYTVTATAVSQSVLSFSPSTVQQSANWVTTTATSQVTVTNTDSSSITITGISIAGLPLTTSGCSGSIAAGGTCTLTISGGPYSSANAGNGSVTFNYTTPVGPMTQAITVSASYQAQPVITANLVVSPSPLGTINAVTNGTPVNVAMNLTNTTTVQNQMSGSDGTLKIKQSSLYPAPANGVTYSYSIAGITTNACPAADSEGYISLANTAGSNSCNYNVVAIGSGGSNTSITSSTPIDIIYQYVAYGTGSLSPLSAVDSNGPQVSATTTVSQAVAELSAPTLVNPAQSSAFVGVEQGLSVGPISFTVKNVGTEAVVGAITAPTIAGFTFDMSTCNNLAVDASCTFTATLSSSSVIPLANLNTSNLTYNTSLTVALPSIQYSVVAPGTPAIALDSVAVGNCQQWSGAVNASTCLINTNNPAPTVTVTLKNNGSAAASNLSITNLVAFKSAFGSGYSQTIADTCTSLSVGGTCAITISPSSGTASTASNVAYDISSTALSYSYNYGTSSQLNATGTTTAVAVDVTIADPSLSIGSIANVPSTGSESATVTLSNWYGSSLPSSPTFSISPTNNITTSTCSWTAVPSTGATCRTDLTTAGTTTAGTYAITATAAGATSAPRSFNVNPVPVLGCGSGKCIFITSGIYNGNLKNGGTNGISPIPNMPASSGTAGADAICQYEAESAGSVIPAGLTFKAVILDSTRTPCGSVGCGESSSIGYSLNWSVPPDTDYYTTSGTYFMTSNMFGVFDYTYSQNAILAPNGAVVDNKQFWIGMNGMLVNSITLDPAPIPGWTSSATMPTSWPFGGGSWGGSATVSVNYCNNWTYGTGSAYSGYTGDNGDFPDSAFGVTGLGNVGFFDFPAGVSITSFNTAGQKPSRWFNLNIYSCALGKPLICVQQ